MFRAEKSYGVTQGKWYFEFEAVTVGEMRVGWARPNVHADMELGADDLAYVFNGFKVFTYIFTGTFLYFYIKSLFVDFSVLLFYAPACPVSLFTHVIIVCLCVFRLSAGTWAASPSDVSGNQETLWAA